MKENGVFKFDSITILPNMKIEDINEDIFTVVNLKNSKIYLGKEKLKVGTISFWIRITIFDDAIKSFELRNADEKYKSGYSNLTNELLEEKYQSHNKFLMEQIDRSSNDGLGYKEYLFEWGNICSFLDKKTGDCGIFVKYN